MKPAAPGIREKLRGEVSSFEDECFNVYRRLRNGSVATIRWQPILELDETMPMLDSE
jgi:hypothetical protein